MSVNEKMTAIANNIRDKTGTTKSLTLDQMESGINEVYEAGKKTEYDAFWDSFQSYGERRGYEQGFYFNCVYTSYKIPVWTDENFKPKYDIKPKGSIEKIFINCAITDFKGILEKQGVVFDTSEATCVTSAFESCGQLTRLPVLNFSGVGVKMSAVFQFCYKLESIDKLILSNSGTQTFSFPFNSCISLKEIRVEGVIGQNFPINHSPLSGESLKSIITHLKNYAGTANEYKYTITLSSSAFEKFEASGQVPPSGNTWAEHIDNLKWNLTLN